MRAALFAKNTVWGQKAHAIALSRFEHVDRFFGTTSDPRPGLLSQEWDVIFSFLSPWILPAEILARAPLAINFHPGSCDYPGIGCYNFALYDEVDTYGVVCHHMLPSVDAGQVIKELQFPIVADETVETLKLRSMDALISLFDETTSLVSVGAGLPVSDRQWQRRPYTRRELNELAVVSCDMDEHEIRRRVRVMTYPRQPGAEINLAGIRFVVPAPDREPLA